MPSSLVEQAVHKVGVKGLLSRLTPAEQVRLLYDWRFWARPDQLPPPGDWLTWLIMTGRGWGKTRTGAETIRHWVETNEASRLAFIGRTPADVRDTMVEGESGIIACSPPSFRPIYEPTRRKLTWPNGATALTFTSYEPDQLRGPQFECIWWDELAAFQYLRETWDNGQLALRLGNTKQIITTTPRSISVLKEIRAAPTTVITSGSTYDNLANLALNFRAQVLARYQGTSLGRQEIEGELVDDVDGALWRRAWIMQRPVPPELTRIVVAIDPAVTSAEGSDETGIIVAGKDHNGQGFVLADRSCRASPDAWARRAVAGYHEFKANSIIAEANNGGDMVALTIHTIDTTVPVKLVHASRAKQARAEPIAALYEQKKMFHCGAFTDLEDQLCSWTPEDGASPDRMDALVWAFTELMLIQKVWLLA